MQSNVLETVRRKTLSLWEEHGLLRESLSIRARALSVREAIGEPGRIGYPLQKGKERLIEADFRGFKGQAYTDHFGDFSGSLANIATLPLENNFQRAVFVAALNASMRSLGLCERTIHCRDQEPRDCAARFRDALGDRHGAARVVLVGYQPAFIKSFGERFALRVIDLDPENIGASRHGILVEGPDRQTDALAWADVIVATGSTLANDSIGDFLGGKPTVFYGTTVAGAAALMGWERFCGMAR